MFLHNALYHGQLGAMPRKFIRTVQALEGPEDMPMGLLSETRHALFGETVSLYSKLR
jgi:hypothetical protein